MASLNHIRAAFLDYFAGHGHEIVASSPLVPRNDPTLMFTNSGMVQFKNVFTGLEQREIARAATSQKCVRAGGKHNDLDNVGYTARHLTFFEMLGNFSFGDYFKELAIPLAWDLLTKEFGLAKDRLLVTIYHDDDVAAEIWKKCSGLPDARIIRIATLDNFWSMGPIGPCGPCSEIFYDHGEGIPGGPPGSPDQDGDRFVEIWNLVFMQFEQFADGRREDLPKPSIDTGMGLERMGTVLQGKTDIYDTDLMRALIEASANASGGEQDGPRGVHQRVHDDHLRPAAFFDVEQYPTATFESKTVVDAGDGTFTIDGQLTIRETTNPVTLELEYGGEATDPWGSTRAVFSASTEIDREAFGLTWNQALEAGGMMVGKIAKLEIDIEAIKQTDEG